MNLKLALITLLGSAIACGCVQEQASNPIQRQPVAITTSPDTSPTSSNAGSFRDVDHPTRGRVIITRDKGQRYIEFDDEFRTDNGPDLYVILHRDSPVGRNIKQQDYVSIARLRQTRGSQRYQLPDNLQLSDYKSVAIWCRLFNVTFGYAPLQP